MSKYRILIVEDEIIIADTIKKYLTKAGHQVVGIAISYQEAETIYLNEKPDLVLLDIRLSGSETGIDVAYFIQHQANPKPFIFLSSQLDSRSISSAKETFPAGYLSKPIQKNSLITTIEIAMHNFQNQRREEPSIILNNGIKTYSIPYGEILFLKADHVYVKVHTKKDGEIAHRGSLKELIEQLPQEKFIQTHRSFVINLNEVNRWDNQNIHIQNVLIPMSRSRRKEVISQVELNKNYHSEHQSDHSEQRERKNT